MATEKILIFDEAGNAKRMKVRIARFLDNEPVTASDKENIRTTLDVDDSLSGTFTTPLSVTSASDSSFTGGGNVTVSGGRLEVESTTGTATTQALTVTDGSSTNFVVQEDGRVGIGTSSPIGPLTVQVAADKNLVTSTQYSGASLEAVNDAYSANIPLAIYGSPIRLLSGNVEVNSGNIVMGSSYGIDFGSVAGGSGTPITNGGLLDDYEAGTFTPQVADATSGGNVGSAATATGSYTKVGRVVHFSIVLADIDTTGMTSGNTFYIRNLPFVSSSDSSTQAQLTAKTDNVTFIDGIVGSVVTGQSNAYLVTLRSANTEVNRTVGHIASGVADILLSGSYIAA